MGGISALGLVGPAQSDELVHFTGRNGDSPHDLPEDIQAMKPYERLDAILRTRRLKAFKPFGVDRRCVCFSESSGDHLAYLITLRLFSPWGVVVTREQAMACGGGSVAYVPRSVHDQFKRHSLEHWAVPTGDRSKWLHEREWRVPLSDGKEELDVKSLAAILIGHPEWRPTPAGTGQWINTANGEPCQPCEDPHCQEIEDLPRLWLESSIWVWDHTERKVTRYPPGELR